MCKDPWTLLLFYYIQLLGKGLLEDIPKTCREIQYKGLIMSFRADCTLQITIKPLHERESWVIKCSC